MIRLPVLDFHTSERTVKGPLFFSKKRKKTPKGRRFVRKLPPFGLFELRRSEKQGVFLMFALTKHGKARIIIIVT